MKKSYIVSFLFIIVVGIFSFAEEKPHINIQPLEKYIFVNQKFGIQLSIKAVKKEVPYCFFPPEVEKQNENLSLEVKKMATQETENDVNLEILIEGVANEAGEYTIGPVRVPYVLLSNDVENEFVKDNSKVIPTSYWDVPSIRIEVKSQAFQKFVKNIYLFLGIIVIIGGVGFFYWFYRNKSRSLRAKPQLTFGETFHIARKYRLDGKYYEYLKTLLEILQSVPEREKTTDFINLEQKLKDKIQEVGYKGIHPTEQEMDFFWKEVSQLVLAYENNTKMMDSEKK